MRKTRQTIILFLIALACSCAARATALSGLLVDEGGQPVSGASVRVLPPGPNVTGDFASPNREDVPWTATGRDGTFRLMAAPTEIAFLQVRHPDFVSIQKMAIEVPSGRSADLGRLTLERGAVVLGKVVDQTGAPLAGIQVWRLLPGEVAGGAFEKERVAVSGPDGSFAVPGYRAGEKARLQLTGPGETAQWIETPAGCPSAVVQTLLVPRSAASGRVLSPKGEPMPGALVYAIHILDPDPDSTVAYRPIWTCADAAGHFSFDAIAEGLYTFSATATDFARGSVQRVTVPLGGRLDGLEVVLRPGASIAGRVVTPDGKPAPGATIHDLASVQSTAADGDGRFRLKWIPTNFPFVNLQVLWNEYSGGASEVKPGTEDLLVVLEPKFGEEVRGRVLGPEGQPVEGASFPGASGRSGADGSFVLRLSRFPGQSFWVRKLGYASLWVMFPQGSLPLELRLQTGAMVTGRLAGLSTAEEARVQVSAQRLDNPGVLGVNDGFGTTDGRGSFRIAHLTPGRWQVVAGVDGRQGKTELTLAPGQTAAVIDLTVPASPEAAVCTPPGSKP